MANDDRDRAVHLLQHYFERAFKHAGRNWDNDNNIEIAEAVDCLIAAAQAKSVSEHARLVSIEIEKLGGKVRKLEPDLAGK